MRPIFLTLLIALAFWLRPAAAQMTPETAARAVAATLIVRAEGGPSRFLGSAFLYGAQDRAVTNAHVVGRAKTVRLEAQDGMSVTARVIAIDHARDLALLALDAPMGPPLQPGGPVPVGAPVYAVGAPLEAGFTLTAGIVSALGRQIAPTQPVRFIQHAAPVNPGSSGGPLLDAAGRVVGVNTRIADGSRFFVGIAYAVPVAQVTRFLSDGALPAHAPGMQVRALGPRMRTALGHTGPGILVEEVRAGSPARAAGLRAGDILTRAAGDVLSRPGDLAFALAASKTEMRVTYLRDGAARDVVLDLTPRAGPSLSTGGQAARGTEYKMADMGLILDPDGTINGVVSQGIGYLMGLSHGDRIAAIDGRAVGDLPADWASDMRFDRPLLLRIALSGGGTRHYVLDPWADPVGLRPSSGANVLDRDVVVFDGL
ncbi:MAG: trypsin-like peptidase domain-containing protein [Pseudomonadota bacterium]